MLGGRDYLAAASRVQSVMIATSGGPIGNVLEHAGDPQGALKTSLE